MTEKDFKVKYSTRNGGMRKERNAVKGSELFKRYVRPSMQLCPCRKMERVKAWLCSVPPDTGQGAPAAVVA